MKKDKLRRRILGQYDSLGDFAKDMGISASGLSKILSGDSTLLHDSVVRWCYKLNVQPSEIGELFYPEVKGEE